MAVLSKKNMKYVRYVLNVVLLGGMALFTGFLSFSCMLVFNSSIYWAIAAFMLAGGIEGEVYAQNISRSLLKLFSGDYLKDLLITRKLDQLIHEMEESDENNVFLKDYAKILKFTQDLEKNWDKDEKQELSKAKKRLGWMRKHFKEFMLAQDGSNIENSPFYEEFCRLVPSEKREEFQEEIRKKARLSWLSSFLNILAGISCAFVGLDVARTSILALSTHFGFAISGAALSAGVIGLAALSSIGYTLMIYNTISNMINDDTLQKWFKTIRNFLHRKTDPKGTPENKIWYGLRLFCGITLVGGIVTLGVFATVATAGTWWYAAKAGAQSIPGLRSAAAVLRTVSVSTMGITQLVYNIVNSLKSAKFLAELSISAKWKQIKNRIEAYREAENDWQFWNPVRIVIIAITFPFMFVSFVGHLIAMGILGDRFEGVDPRLTTAVTTANEGLMDAHNIFDVDDHHLEEKEHVAPMRKDLVMDQAKIHHSASRQEHSHGGSHGHEHGHSHSHESSPQEHPTQAHKKHHYDHEEHDHHHVDIAGWVLKGILTAIPLYPLSAAWDYYFSSKNTGKEAGIEMSTARSSRASSIGSYSDSQAETRSNNEADYNIDLNSPDLNIDPEREQLSVRQALRKAYFGLSKSAQIKKPQLSSTWLQFEKTSQIERMVSKHQLEMKKETTQETRTEHSIIETLKEKALTASSNYGDINSNLFFQQNRLPSSKAHKLCEKIIERVNCTDHSEVDETDEIPIRVAATY